MLIFFTSSTYSGAKMLSYFSASEMACSVTRFGEVLPLWELCNNFWPFLEDLFSVCPSSEPTLAHFNAIG